MTRARRSDVGSAPYRRNTPSAARVIVFLHGLFGDSQDTWTCSTASPPAYWPDLLRGDAIFDDADIYAAAYDSPYYGNTMALYQVAENLNIRLVADAVFSRHKEVVFVVHSLGGLVIQQLLLTYREYAAQVPFIYFYSTPDTGAQLARLGAHFSADPILKQLIPGNQNIYLANMESEWQHAGFGAIRRHCVYETLSTGGFVVVDRLSGTRSCDASVPINEDHISIVKPCDRRADSYLALLNAYSALKARGNTER
jgi:pimeloyl-ACP methyl ester carboxylesterase